MEEVQARNNPSLDGYQIVLGNSRPAMAKCPGSPGCQVCAASPRSHMAKACLLQKFVGIGICNISRHPTPPAFIPYRLLLLSSIGPVITSSAQFLKHQLLCSLQLPLNNRTVFEQRRDDLLVLYKIPRCKGPAVSKGRAHFYPPFNPLWIVFHATHSLL
ncbi:hypothetical protein BR93DRAFT_536420 [Coniochaeta sp. PMI_546]|nr:hypothetical protein BR93DRAFT_536420 [Coniochaeta sp. PMI_546]